MLKIHQFVAAALTALLLGGIGSDAAFGSKMREEKRLEREHRQREEKKFENMIRLGKDQVSMTEEAAALRSYELRKKKTKGLLKKREVSLAHVLFPGASPEEYMPRENIPVFVDLIESKKTQVPFEYYDLPTCQEPNEKIARRFRERKNLGSRLLGHDRKPAPYFLSTGISQSCKTLCDVSIGGKYIKWMRKLVDRQYRIHLTLDQLPVLMRSRELNYAARGYPIGFKISASSSGLSTDEYFLYNHLKFTVNYREEPSEFEGIRIIGFDVHPVSINHDEGTCDTPDSSPINDSSTYLPLRAGPAGENLQVTYSIEVNWVATDISWADRWDVYLVGSPDDEIHLFAIINSLMIVAFLGLAVATILIRTLKRDIAGYNELQTLEESQEESGWKLVHGDVFRPPQYSMALSVLVGTGAQIGTTFFVVLLASMMRLLNPVKKGQTLTAMIVVYVLCGSVSGYISSRLYKFCDAKSWKQNTLATAISFPAVLVSMFMILNFFLTIVGAATAVSFLTIFFLFFLWVCVSTPLVFVGSYFGIRGDKLEVPTKTNQIARVIPEGPWYINTVVSAILTGMLPFGSVCIELFFIMGALWLHQLYYIMGFLMAVLLILVATCAEVSMVACYLQLVEENHRWWWRSFWNCASAGVFLFLYSLWYLSTKLQLVGFLPVVVYLTYMTMISLAFSVLCGSVGVLSCFWFNRMIYGAVKVD